MPIGIYVRTARHRKILAATARAGWKNKRKQMVRARVKCGNKVSRALRLHYKSSKAREITRQATVKVWKGRSKVERKRILKPVYEAGLKALADRGYAPSKPQLSIFRTLCRLGISGIRSEFRVGKYRVDIAHLPSRTVVEVDGKHWHNPITDRRKSRYLGEKGWKVVRVHPKRGFLVKECHLKRILKAIGASK